MDRLESAEASRGDIRPHLAPTPSDGQAVTRSGTTMEPAHKPAPPLLDERVLAAFAYNTPLVV